MAQPTAPTATATPAAPTNAAPSANQLMADMAATMKAMAAEIETLKAKQAEVPAAPVQHAGPKKAAWSEDILVEAIHDCVYPDPHDTYGKYRRGRIPGEDIPGAIFRIAHREHLNEHMREVTKDEADIIARDARIASQFKSVPTMANRQGSSRAPMSR